MSMLENKSCSAEIYMEPDDSEVTDEDSGDEDGGELLHNLWQPAKRPC